MNTDYLFEFTELAKHLNFTETARLLNMTQPTLSKHISSLERELRVELFIRKKGELKLTNEGAALLPYAYKIVDAQSAFSSKVKSLRKAPPSRLVVSGLTDEGPSTEVLGFLVSLLNEAGNPGLLEVKPDHDLTPEDALLGGHANFVMDPAPTDEPLDENEIGAILVGVLPLVAFVDKESPFARYDELPFEEFQNAEFLKCEGLYINRSWCYIEEACRRHGFTPRTRSHYCPSIAALLAACANLENSVLMLGRNFVQRVPTGIAPFCKQVRITDKDVTIPLRLLYRKNDPNPLVDYVVNRLETSNAIPLQF